MYSAALFPYCLYCETASSKYEIEWALNLVLNEQVACPGSLASLKRLELHNLSS